MKSNIVLTGFMGTGKTTAGKIVANKLNMKFVDIDNMIEKQEGMKISQIFSEKGEKHFRDIESEMVKTVSKWEHCVISTGGGVVLREQNIKLLREKGLIILLKANEESIIKHIFSNNNRPLLNDKNREEKIKTLLNQREKYYNNNDYEIDGSNLTIYELADKIIKVWGSSK